MNIQNIQRSRHTLHTFIHAHIRTSHIQESNRQTQNFLQNDDHDSSVGMMSSLRAGRPWNCGSVTGRASRLPSPPPPQNNQTAYGAHTASYSIGTGGKAATQFTLVRKLIVSGALPPLRLGVQRNNTFPAIITVLRKSISVSPPFAYNQAPLHTAAHSSLISVIWYIY
jgi:hypothetical protein